MQNTNIIAPEAVEGMPISPDYKLRINGADVTVSHCEVAGYAPVSFDGPADIEIEALNDFKDVCVRPLRHGIQPEIEGRTVRFGVEGPWKLSVEFDGDLRKPLFIFATAPETERPDPKDETVRYFEAGKVHEAGEIRLESGQTVYIEAGAVVRGFIRGDGVENIRVAGRGILDASQMNHSRDQKREHVIRFVDCKNIEVEGISIIDPPCWTLVHRGCRDSHIHDVHIVTWVMGGDGIDMVGCRDMLVENCFARCKDDCIAIKASTYRDTYGGRNVSNITVRDSVFWNAETGNALEIGYETQCDEMRDIVFRNCDIIHTEKEGYQSGGTLTIHNGDRADIHNVLYEDIRIEDTHEKLIDLKVLVARYTRDDLRGHIRDITFRNIQLVDGRFPPSIIRGHEPDNMIQNVTIENLTAYGKKVADAIDAHMIVELSREVVFV
ncbi:MAG: glycosyl hydrolase family 28 protein [Candidatus Sumerlaeota bacterium]